MISTNQITCFKRREYFEDDESFVVSFSCHLGHVFYSDLTVKTSEISNSRIEVTIWLISIVNTKKDQYWGFIRSSMRYRKCRSDFIQIGVGENASNIWVRPFFCLVALSTILSLNPMKLRWTKDEDIYEVYKNIS